jgi:phosphopantothenoylcysteine decarboxylase / phosphopantothenate---cysteine ligase
VADDFLSSTYLASNAPVLVAPAMNTSMWEQPATQRNIEQLKKDGVRFVEPIAGELACKTVGTGKLEDVENIVAQAMQLLSEPTANAGGSDLAAERILITVGGTREAIDPVRYISNHSSGKMGYAIAEAAAARGADVTLVAGWTTVDTAANVKVFRVITAAEMHAAVMRELPNATVFVGTAAVADYAPAAANSKIKKDGNDTMTLELAKTPDILSDVSRNRHDGLLVVGFAAETNDVIDYARSKMEKKALDMVVANDITKEGAGFNTDTNIATILTRHGGEKDLPLMPKRELADLILDEIAALRTKM